MLLLVRMLCSLAVLFLSHDDDISALVEGGGEGRSDVSHLQDDL